MDLRNFVLTLKYVYGGKKHSIKLNKTVLTAGYKNAHLSAMSTSGEDKLSVRLSAPRTVKMISAEAAFDYEYQADEKFFSNGYQSWTTSREYGRGDRQYGLRGVGKVPFGKKRISACGDYHFTKYARKLYHGFTYAYLRRGRNLTLLGSLDEHSGFTVFYADMKRGKLTVSKDVEGLELVGDYNLFDVAIYCGGYDEVFDKYFEEFPLKHTGRVDRLTGYTSWYNYFQNIDENIILRDLDGLDAVSGMTNIFQIDDGYETYIGDWDVDPVKFPNGLKGIVDKVHGKGMLAGLWAAPFSAQFKSNVAANHRDWLIRKKRGGLLYAGMAWGGFYALDLEKTEVKDYLKAFFDRVFDEWGFDMVKLDFLYSACIIPRNGKTRGQLMCEAMEFLRECCRDKIILGCGVPLGPSFGIVDACRVSCDAEVSFKDKFYVDYTNQEVVSTRNAMTSNIFRRHLDGRIMANDPDVFFLRDGGMTPANYTLQQKQLLSTINKMCGSVLFVSDNVGEYDQTKLNLLKSAYTPFDGKVTFAEFADKHTVAVEYQTDGKTFRLTYDVYSGDYKVEGAVQAD
ncbi:MAG: alpha-galactosidase [Corallococcus sp.]|nr:alpha-galactosidase [Corallococcus sp.]